MDAIRSRTKGNTSAFIEISDDSDSDMDVPMGSGGTLLNTQNASGQHGISVGLKTPPDPHTDRSAQAVKPWDPGFQQVIAPFLRLRPSMEPPGRSSQPLMKPREGSEQPQRAWKPPPLHHGSQPLTTPPDRSLLPTTLARRPAYRRRPFGNLDDELDQYDEDDHDDDHDDHDHIDDSETDNSDSMWEPCSSKKRKSPLKKTLLTCLPGPSAPEPKLPIVRCNGQSTLENPNPAVTSDSHVHPTPSSQRRSPVPAAVDKATGDKAYSVLTITMRYSKICNKDVHVRYFTSSSASHIHSPPSQTPCWTFEPEDLYLHWQGPSNSTCGSGSGETGGTWRPIQAGYSHPHLPGHQFQVLKSARPTWIMELTWQKRYRRGRVCNSVGLNLSNILFVFVLFSLASPMC